MNIEFRLRISDEHELAMADALRLGRDKKIKLNKEEVEVLSSDKEYAIVRLFGKFLANPKVSEKDYRYSGYVAIGKDNIKDLEKCNVII